MPILLQLVADKKKYKNRCNMKNMLLCTVLLAIRGACRLFVRSVKQNHDHGL